MSETMRAVVTDPNAPGNVRLGELPVPEAGPQQVRVRVSHFSLNRGELNFAGGKPAGSAVGWDVAGTVSASSDERLPEGTRVVAFSQAQQGWAEEVALPARDVAVVPDDVTLADAAALPVAAGTALAALDLGQGLAGRRVLITGTTGGVGGYAVQLARSMGATVVAQVRKAEQVVYAEGLGADEVVVSADGAALADAGPFRMAVDGVGGDLLSQCVANLEADGVAVTYGGTGGAAGVPAGMMVGKGRASLRGLNLYAVSEVQAPSVWLGRLLELVRRGRLRADITERGGWQQVSEVAADLLARKFTGKAVVKVE